MKALPWIIAGVALGAAVVFVLSSAPEPAYTTGDPDVEDAARKTSAWGTKQRLGGTGSSLLGKAKEGVGDLTGDDSLAGEGLLDQAASAIPFAISITNLYRLRVRAASSRGCPDATLCHARFTATAHSGAPRRGTGQPALRSRGRLC